MVNAILKKFVLLEIQNIKLKNIKQKIKSNKDSNKIDLTGFFENLALDWNKTYKKFGHLILSLISNIDKTEDLLEELNKILEVISKFDKYYNTSPLKERIAGIDSSFIDVSLKEIELFLNRKASEEFIVKRDKISLQEILDLCKPLTPGKVFKSEEYDLIACKEQYLVVKPKTPKASVAWSMSGPDGNLERYGKGDIPKDAKPPWCTSIYSSNKDSNNEFYHYFLNQYKTLYYVIKREDYSFGDPFRKVSIGVDDSNSKLEFDNAISVNSNNDFIRSEGEFIGNFKNSNAAREVISAIEEDNLRQEYLLIKKTREEPEASHISVLFENRFKSFDARSKIQYFIQKSGDPNFLIQLLDIYTAALKENVIARDERDTSDIIRTFFEVKAFLNKLTFSKQEQLSFKKVIDIKSSSIMIDAIDCIKDLLESSKSNLIDDSIFYLIFSIIDNSTIKYINRELRSIISLIKEKSLMSERLIKRLDDSLQKRDNFFAILLATAKNQSNIPSFKLFIENEAYKYKYREVNKQLLKNILLFKTQEGIDLIDKVFFKKTDFIYFEETYESIFYNLEFKKYDRIEELVNLFIEDKYFTHAFLEVYSYGVLTIRDLMSSDNLLKYIQKVYDLYSGKKDEHSKEIIELSDSVVDRLGLSIT